MRQLVDSSKRCLSEIQKLNNSYFIYARRGNISIYNPAGMLVSGPAYSEQFSSILMLLALPFNILKYKNGMQFMWYRSTQRV